MKHVIPSLAVALAIATAGSTTAAADDVAQPAWTVGYSIQRYQDDFGTGLLAATPTFLGDSLRVTLGGGLGWYPHATNDDGDQDWAPYGDVRLVLEGGHRAPGTQVRTYGFAGPVLFITPSRLSDERVSIGGTGGFGFEYYFMSEKGDGPVSYFTELGGIGTNTRADRLPGRPLIANGFAVTAGFRFHL